MLFKVSYSLQKDIENYLNSVWKFSYRKFGREKPEDKFLTSYPVVFRKQIRKARSRKEAEKVIYDFLNSLPKNFQDLIPVIAKGVEVILNENQKEIVNILEKVYGQKFPFKHIKVYLTTAPIFPYNYKELWFMTGRNSSLPKHISTAKHELNHFMFYYYYADELTKQGVSLTKQEKFKEALAILTNPEGNDKPEVKELEKFILKHKDKPLEKIIALSLKSGVL